MHMLNMYVYVYIYIQDDSLNIDGRNHSHAVVMKLVEKLEGRGHHVYTDNFYSSPALFVELRERGFGACGTVRTNRRGLPPEMKNTWRCLYYSHRRVHGCIEMG